MTDHLGFTKDDGTEVTAEQQRTMAEKIGKLVAMSEDESLPAAARASYAEKAEHLMREYRVNEERVISTAGSSIFPAAFEIVLIYGNGRWYQSEFQDSYTRIWREVANHAGLKSHVQYQYDDEQDTRSVVAVGFGYEMDIRLAQFLWTSAHLTFATRIDAKVDPNLSDQLNCYFMRGSGMERNDIANALWSSAYTDGAAHGKVQKLYLAECVARGETPSVGGKGFQAKRYRKAYAEGFGDQFGWRLRDARSAVDAKSGGLVLAGREERVAEAYYEAYPKRRPMNEEQMAAQQAESDAYWAARDEEERKCRESGKCSKTKNGCRTHRAVEVTVAQRARWDRECKAPERTAGRRAGAAAASAVEFRRTAGERAQHAEAAPSRVQIG
jgi:hypothetical protein